MATWRKLLLAFVSLSLLNLSLVTNAHITSSSYSYLPDLRPRASSTTSTLDCTQTTTSNVSACYPNLNKLPICCQPCIVNVTLLQPCASTDFHCLCAHSSEIQLQTLSCINGTCSTQDEQTAINFYYGYCNSMDYPLSAVPSSTTATPSTTATTIRTTTASPTSTTSSTPGPSPTTSASASPSNQSLAPVAAAGIGISFAGLLLVAAGTIFFLHRRRQKALVGNRLPDEAGEGNARVLDRIETAPPSYPTVQEIDGKTVVSIALQERSPDSTVTRDLSDLSTASTVTDTGAPPVIHEMDTRRPWSWGRSRQSPQTG